MIYAGKLGKEYTVQEGQEAAKLVALNCLVTTKEALGDLPVKCILYSCEAIRQMELTVQPLLVHGKSHGMRQDWRGKADDHGARLVSGFVNGCLHLFERDLAGDGNRHAH